MLSLLISSIALVICLTYLVPEYVFHVESVTNEHVACFAQQFIVEVYFCECVHSVKSQYHIGKVQLLNVAR